MERQDGDAIKDCQYLQAVAKANGINASLNQCEAAWQQQSDEFFASWLIVDREGSQYRDDGKLWKHFEPYLTAQMKPQPDQSTDP